jgi:hypothetical protein
MFWKPLHVEGVKKEKKRNTSGEVKKRSLLPYLVKSKRIISQSLFFYFWFLGGRKAYSWKLAT